MFGFGVILAAATCDLQLGVFETGLLASAPFAGIIFAFPWGYYADTQGRRRALLLSTSVGFLMAILVGFAPDWKVMLALKFIGCSFSTAGFNLTMTYLGECTGSKRRSKYLFIINSAELAAEFVFYTMAYLLLRLDFELFIPYLSISFRPWRLYALLLSVPLGLGTFLLLFLYESPKFLASRRDTEQALRVMRTMYRINGGNEDTYPVKTLKVPANEESTKDSFWSSIVNQTVPLFKPPLLWRTIQLFYLMAICCSTY
ncbi:synaptic vesicle glycoprotein 2C-like, partial [Hyposmocoma kahamanoa]|uniref:synaptic vesicle glycoprotein 2C-like n=1 Tax=Hyposmocoma kahamanoa TaxID=1477025 RepID=UPI000E6D77A7